MQRDADLALQHGADGLVFDILTAEGHVDGERCRRLVAQAGERAFFDRAFDVISDPFTALEQLIDLGFRRVMTSKRCTETKSTTTASVVPKPDREVRTQR